MALVTSLHLPNTPPTTTLHISLFTNVQNAAFLHQQLLDGNTAFEYAFLDPTTLLSTTHLLAAAFRALNDLTHHRLRTRNVHSEIVFSLSPNNNIAESFRRFGIQPTSTSVLAVKIGTAETPDVTADGVREFLTAHVQGVSWGFTDENLARLTDWAVVKKIYKLNTTVVGAGARKSGKVNGVRGNKHGVADVSQEERQEMEMIVLGIMALKGP